MTEKKSKRPGFKPAPDIAEWLQDLVAVTGVEANCIINTGLREYIKSHTRDEIEAHIRQAGESGAEWPEKGGFAKTGYPG